MSNKQIISNLLDKLKVCQDPSEKDNIEEQILFLAEMDENELIYENSKKKKSLNITNLTDLTNIPNTFENIDPKEKIRQDRANQQNHKEIKYKEESKLENIDDELLRTQLMNEALATNNEYTFQKTRKNTGPKNKSKKIKK